MEPHRRLMEESCFIDGAQYIPIADRDAVAGYAKVPVKVQTIDAAGRVVDEKSCKMIAGAVATKPAKPEDIGVDVARIAAPVSAEQLDQLNSSAHRSGSWVFVADDKARANDAPPIEDGLTAVQPQIAWMMIEVGSIRKGLRG